MLGSLLLQPTIPNCGQHHNTTCCVPTSVLPCVNAVFLEFFFFQFVLSALLNFRVSLLLILWYVFLFRTFRAKQVILLQFYTNFLRTFPILRRLYIYSKQSYYLVFIQCHTYTPKKANDREALSDISVHPFLLCYIEICGKYENAAVYLAKARSRPHLKMFGRQKLKIRVRSSILPPQLEQCDFPLQRTDLGEHPLPRAARDFYFFSHCFG